MWHARHRAWHVVRAINSDLKKLSVLPVIPSRQASRLIVTFDEHVISNNFKFGVIYQKLGQVCSPPPPCSLPRLGRVPGTSDLCQGERLPRVSASQGCGGSPFQPSLGCGGGAAPAP